MGEKSTHLIGAVRSAFLAATIVSLAIPAMAQSGNFPGNPVSALVIDPAAPATLYVASYPGVYKSTNGGATWVGVSSTGAWSLAIDPHATSAVYTENAKSTDGGATWTALGFTGNAFLVMDPQTPSTLYVADKGGASKSTDGGVTWVDFSTGLSSTIFSHGSSVVYHTGFESLAITPQTSTLFGGTIIPKNYSDPSGFPGSTGIDRRAGTDTRWNGVFSSLFLSAHFVGFAMDPADSSVVYAAATNTTGGPRGVLKSVDSGATWDSSKTGFPFPQDATAIAVDPVNTSTVYAGTSLGIYKSVNGGSSWTPCSDGFPKGALITVLAIDPQTPSTIYAGTALGVYKSTDAGASWIAANNGLNTGRYDPSSTRPILSNSNPVSGQQDSIVTVVISGTAFWDSPFGIDAGKGISLRDISKTGSTLITATFVVAPDAPIGTRNLVVTGVNGVSNSLPFTVTAASQVPLTLSGISPESVRRARSGAVTLTGTNFTPSLTVDAGNGIAVASLAVISSTSATATFSIASDAALGVRNVTVSSFSGGKSNPAALTVIPEVPTLTEASPSFLLAGKSTAVRLTGTFLISPLTVDTDSDISVSNVVVDPSGTSATAVFAAAQNAVLGIHRIGVTTPGGRSGASFSGGRPFLLKSLTRQSDFNGDGNADLLWYYPPTGETVMWLMNGTSVLGYASLLRDSDWIVTATGDFNGDGKADLVWYNARAGQTSMWLMSGTTVTSSAVLFTDPYWKVTSTGDFNGDGKTDLVWTHAPSGQISTWWMNGTTRLNFFGLPGNPNFEVASTGDFNEANFRISAFAGPIGFDDLVGRNPATGETAAWVTLGPGTWTSRSLNTDPNWKTIGLPDLDGDGNSDMLWYNATTGQTNGWLVNGGPQPIDTPLLTDPDWKVIATGDIDGDLKSDLIWYNAVTGQTVGWLMNGTSISNWAVLPATPGWKVTSTGDFNGDGKIDLVWTNAATGQTVLWLMNGLAPSSSSLLLTDPEWRTISPGK